MGGCRQRNEDRSLAHDHDFGQRNRARSANQQIALVVEVLYIMDERRCFVKWRGFIVDGLDRFKLGFSGLVDQVKAFAPLRQRRQGLQNRLIERVRSLASAVYSDGKAVVCDGLPLESSYRCARENGFSAEDAPGIFK